MAKQTLKVALLIVVLAAAGVGYVVSQLLVEHTIQGTVSVASQPGLYVLDGANKPVTVLDFGTLTNGAKLSASVRLYNSGNTPLTIAVERTDDSTGISSEVKRQDGQPYDAPATLGMGESLYLVFTVWNTASLPAGQYPLSFRVTGS